jgi:hypothetical protein
MDPYEPGAGENPTVIIGKGSRFGKVFPESGLFEYPEEYSFRGSESRGFQLLCGGCEHSVAVVNGHEAVGPVP